MTRIIGILLAVIVAIPVVLIAVLALLLANPEIYRDRLYDAFTDETGFVLAIDGDMRWRYFPPIALSISDVTIRPAGSDQPLASLQSADIDLDLLPLVFGSDIAINGFSTDGVTVNLEVNERGEGNWEVTSPSPAAEDETSATTDETGMDLGLNIQAINVLNTTVNYVDRSAGTDYTINIPALALGAIDLDKPAPLAIQLNLQDNTAGVAVDMQGDGEITIATRFSQIRLDDFAVSKRVVMPGMNAIVANVTASGSYDVAKSHADLSWSGSIDDIQASGTTQITIGDLVDLDFDLTLDQVNLNTYMTSGEPSGEATAVAPEDVDVLPLETLRALTIDGKLGIGRLIYDTWSFSDVGVSVKHANNRLNTEAGLSGLGGAINLHFNANTGGNGSGQTRLSASGLDVTELSGFEWITGKINVDSNTTFSGHRLSQILNTLNGPTSFEIQDGVLDVRPIKRIAIFVDSIRGETSRVASWPDQMPFQQMTGSHQFNNGTATGQQLEFTLETLSGNASGGFDYLANQLNYDIRLRLLRNEGPFSVGPALARIEWPLHCEGALDATAMELCLPDNDAIRKLLGDVAKQEVQRRVEDKIKDKVKDALRGFLNR